MERLNHLTGCQIHAAACVPHPDYRESWVAALRLHQLLRERIANGNVHLGAIANHGRPKMLSFCYWINHV